MEKDDDTDGDMHLVHLGQYLPLIAWEGQLSPRSQLVEPERHERRLKVGTLFCLISVHCHVDLGGSDYNSEFQLLGPVDLYILDFALKKKYRQITGTRQENVQLTFA